MAELDEIGDYVARTVRLCREAAPDLCFGEAENRGKITIDGIDAKARYVRIQLTAPGILHLKQIEIFSQVGTDVVNIAPTGSITTSSVFAGTGQLNADGRFLNDHEGKFGFHTNKDDDPWVCVDLQDTFDLRRIEIFNRQDEWASRAWKLAVEVSPDGTQWTEIYHYNQPLEMLGALLAYRRKHFPGQPPMAIRELIDCLIPEVLVGAYNSAHKRLHSTTELGSLIKRRIMAAITGNILASRRLEWTNHSVLRTFRYWTNEQKANYLDFANRLNEQIISLGFDACLGYGSVLCIVREQDFIKHDDDLDIIVSLPRDGYPTLGAGLEELFSRLKALDYRVTGDYATHRHVTDGTSTHVDVFIGFEEDQFVSWFPGPRKVLLKTDVFPGIRCSLFGIQCLIPRNPFRYVETVYGPDWMVPVSRWDHVWDRSKYKDWFSPQEARVGGAAAST